MTQLYDDEELALFTGHIGDILAKIDDIVGSKLDPTRREIVEITKIVEEYLKKNKRKIYGGSAVNLAVKSKNIEAAFYSADEYHDYDVYSPEPINDVIKICNILHEKGYKNIAGRSALHKESFTVVVNDHAYCDFSYSPKNVYNRTPFLELEGFTVTHPQFMWIDYLRAFTDPILSARFRWEKYFKRFYLLQKYYPIRKTNKRIIFKEKPIKNEIYDLIIEYLKKSNTLITTGQYVYNTYVDISKIESKYITKIPITNFELIATEYVKDVKDFIEYLKSKNLDVHIKEYYPFFHFTGYATEIIVDNNPIIKIYNYNKICLPYIEHRGIRIGSFHFNLLRTLIDATYARINNNKDYEALYFEMASHFIQMRRTYMAQKDKTFLDDTLFRDFSGECMGFTQQAKIEKMEEKRRGEKVFNWSYNPEKPGSAGTIVWSYDNSSGNVIHNPKNYMITLDIPNLHIVEEEHKDSRKIVKKDTKHEETTDTQLDASS